MRAVNRLFINMVQQIAQEMMYNGEGQEYEIWEGRVTMKIIEFFESNEKEHWLGEIKRSDWGAGQYLYQLLSEN